MKYLLLLLFVAFQNAGAQTVTFKEIKLRPNSKFYQSKVSTIIYPLLVTNNKAADKLMNNKIMADMVGEDVVNLRPALAEEISGGFLTDMEYEVTYRKNGILSLTITSTGCGAYCSTGSSYFNFDLKTGKSIQITDLVNENMLDSFRNIVLADKIKALNIYKTEETELLSTDAGIDSATVNWAIEQVDDYCIGSLSTDNFTLSNLGIEIKDPCEFPHAIMSQQPLYELKYSYSFLFPFLKQKFQRLFSK